MVSGETSMVSGEYGTPPPPPPGVMAGTWQATLFLGVLTLILGLIVSFHPTGSLNVLAVLLGVLMIFSGIFHLIRVFDPEESHRVWLGIAGLLFIVIGVVLIRHLHLTVAAIGLLIGITWIIQGLAALIGGISGGAREGRAWWIIFGAVSRSRGSWSHPPPPPRSTSWPSCSVSGSSSWASSRSQEGSYCGTSSAPCRRRTPEPRQQRIPARHELGLSPVRVRHGPAASRWLSSVLA